MKTYKDVKARIAELEKTAEAMLQRELKSIVAQVKKTIAEYQLTAADLGFGAAGAAGTRKRAASKPGKVAKTVGVAKYRDPATQKTWTGRGKPPGWIVGVKDRSAYLINAEASTAAPEPTPVKAAKKGKASA